MSYENIGQKAWDAKPNIFGDPAFAEALEAKPGSETRWVSYTYNVNGIPMEAGVSYSSLTGLFTKFVRRTGVA